MLRAAAVFFCLVLFVSSVAEAQDTPSIGESCIRAKLQGDASTYNPNYYGWKTGGQGLATGGRYNGNNYEAALQLDLAKKYGCGYGSGRTCQAVVESSETKNAAIVLINDNGPLTSGRIIDLNEKSMQYLSNGKYGRNSGVLRNVTVTLLSCNMANYLGPLNGADRQKWAGNIDSMAPTQITPVYNNPANPYSPVSVSPFSALGASPSQLGQASANPLSGNVGAATSPFNVNTPVSALLRGEGNSVVGDRSASTILLQPTNARKGSTLLVSWTSVNMKPALCMMRLNDEEFARGNEATQRYVIPDTASTLKFTLECETAAGEKATSAASITL